MTANPHINTNDNCPGENTLKLLSGKWKPQLFKIAASGPIRFNNVLRELPQANRQSISVALHDLESAGMLSKNVISQKPLHIEYVLTEKGRSMLDVYKQLARISLDYPEQ